jgi:hypothetical protein
MPLTDPFLGLTTDPSLGLTFAINLASREWRVTKIGLSRSEAKFIFVNFNVSLLELPSLSKESYGNASLMSMI